MIAAIKADVDSERERRAADFWESGSAFLRSARALPNPRMLIGGLVPGDGITLGHADPRTLKTWLQLEAGIGLTTGRPVGGHCHVASACSVGFITNEDGKQRVGERLDALLRGYGLLDLPDAFYFAVHRGVWLDDVTWQQRVIDTVKDRAIDLLMLDPLRSLSACIDQGPRELQPFAIFLRRLQDETGCAIWLNHHNTKPQAGQKDDRRRPHRASGGGLFSIADAPLMLERVGDTNRVIVTPSGWKFAQDPPPLELTLSTVQGSDGQLVEARLVTGPAEAPDAAETALRARVLDFLAENPGAAGSHVAAGIRANKDAVLKALKTLDQLDRVDCTKTARQNRWFIRRAAVPSVPSGSRTDTCSGSSGSPYGGGNRGTDEPLQAGTDVEDGHVRV
jgi:AAA domain